MGHRDSLWVSGGHREFTLCVSILALERSRKRDLSQMVPLGMPVFLQHRCASIQLKAKCAGEDFRDGAVAPFE